MRCAGRSEVFGGMPVFGAIRNDALEVPLEHARTGAVPSGEFFFRENDPASAMFVLEAGRAAVVKGWRGRDLVLHQLGAGGCFGEMALINLLPRGGSVRAV